MTGLLLLGRLTIDVGFVLRGGECRLACRKFDRLRKSRDYSRQSLLTSGGSERAKRSVIFINMYSMIHLVYASCITVSRGPSRTTASERFDFHILVESRGRYDPSTWKGRVVPFRRAPEDLQFTWLVHISHIVFSSFWICEERRKYRGERVEDDGKEKTALTVAHSRRDHPQDQWSCPPCRR